MNHCSKLYNLHSNNFFEKRCDSVFLRKIKITTGVSLICLVLGHTNLSVIFQAVEETPRMSSAGDDGSWRTAKLPQNSWFTANNRKGISSRGQNNPYYIRQNRELIAKIQYLRNYTLDTVLIFMLSHYIDELQQF